VDGATGERDNHSMFDVCFATAAEELDQARILFREYADQVDAPCCFATFNSEVESLPGEYALPTGRLLLARKGSEAAGCVSGSRQASYERLILTRSLRLLTGWP